MKKTTPIAISKIFAINFINRFSRIKLNQHQNVAAHTSIVCILIDLIGMLENERRKDKNLPLINMHCALRKGLWHDVSEIFLSDVPAPIKVKMEDVLKKIEYDSVENELLADIDKNIQEDVRKAIFECKDGLEGELVDFCDKIERLIYIFYEKKSGNTLLMEAFKNTLEDIEKKEYEEKFPEGKKLLRFFEKELME